MTEAEHRNETYRIFEEMSGTSVEGNETGWYDGFIEDCYKDGVSPEMTAKSIMFCEARCNSQALTTMELANA